MFLCLADFFLIEEADKKQEEGTDKSFISFSFKWTCFPVFFSL